MGVGKKIAVGIALSLLAVPLLVALWVWGCFDQCSDPREYATDRRLDLSRVQPLPDNPPVPLRLTVEPDFKRRLAVPEHPGPAATR